MITAYVLHAAIVFAPGPASTDFTDRVMPIKLSFDSQEACTSTLRARIAEHMRAKNQASVRQHASSGVMCQPREIEAAYTDKDDQEYRQLTLDEIRGVTASKGVLSEFSK